MTSPRRTNLIWGMAVAFLAVALLQGTTRADTVDVSIGSFVFIPQALTINVGQTVRWTNNHTFNHTVTEDALLFDSGTLLPGQTFSFTFNAAGVYPYHCSIHLSMTGTITVNGPNQPPILNPIGPKSVTENSNLNFGVSATDPDATIPTLTTSALPSGAGFTDHGNGTGTFNWTPIPGQKGSYDVTFRASDGLLLDTEIVTITVNSCCIKAGDANNNGAVNLLDVTFLINRLFKGGALPPCPAQADANGNGAVNLLDVTYLINFLFKSASAPICP
jgi:plastocyanin